MQQYLDLMQRVMKEGELKEDRTGTGTKSIFGHQMRFDLSDGFPCITTKKLHLKSIIHELLWFLKGDTNIKYLQDNNCHIWDGDYNKSDRTDGWLGKIYGHQWRKLSLFGVQYDQIKTLIEGLKENPDSRRHLVNAWNVYDLDYMTLPPCHYSFQCYVAGNKLSLLWNQRSADLFLGVPFNISSYGLLLELLCVETGYEPGDLIGNFGDIHLYKNHIEQAKEQISRKPFELPQLGLVYENILEAKFEAQLQNYQCHPAIKAPLSN